ncbi:hypothetical protein HY989_00255 [Candidatus Micrarchaeota archaeon]|nr:hypothetical protein [Candidatus Micrarchaeota archaeon]
MVLKEEACCPKCFTFQSFIVPLNFSITDTSFRCPRNTTHVFEEDEEGFLHSKA